MDLDHFRHNPDYYLFPPDNPKVIRALSPLPKPLASPVSSIFVKHFVLISSSLKSGRQYDPACIQTSGCVHVHLHDQFSIHHIM